MDGIYADERDPSQIHLVEIGAVHYRNEYNAGIRYDRVYSFVQQKEDAVLSTELGSKKSYTQTSSELSVAQLLEIASKTYPNELSEDILEHFGLKRESSRFEGLRYSKQIQEAKEAISDTKEKKDLNGNEKIEKTKDFIAVHNLTMDQLMKDIDMGGFPSPSTAIIRSAMQHTRYSGDAMKGNVANRFADACARRGESQASVMTRLMEE